MKFNQFVVVVVSLLAGFNSVASLGASQSVGHQAPPFDLPPDASVEQMYASIHTNNFDVRENEEAVRVGLKNHAWLDRINLHRPEGKKLSFTSAASASGAPIDHPAEYSPSLIDRRLQDARAQMPEVMKAVLFGDADTTDDLPVVSGAPMPEEMAEELFLEQGRRIDRIYQSALRWRLMQPYLPYLIERRARDVRGYYFLTQMNPSERKAKLAEPKKWSESERQNFVDWLTQICTNGGKAQADCLKDISAEVSAGNDVNPVFDTWVSAGKAIWDSFFAIDLINIRGDINYDQGAVFNTGFLEPGDPRVRRFLQDNIEDEWHIGDWHLRLNFTPTAETHVKFVPGATPHVDRLGGSEITMNADQPLTEYDANWVIRHEFGHTLGFPDCYIEFYDQDRQVMVSYQLDLTDLMCSRRGHLLNREIVELRRAYTN